MTTSIQRQKIQVSKAQAIETARSFENMIEEGISPDSDGGRMINMIAGELRRRHADGWRRNTGGHHYGAFTTAHP